jgi:hypothetical protein
MQALIYRQSHGGFFAFLRFPLCSVRFSAWHPLRRHATSFGIDAEHNGSQGHDGD